MITWEWEFFFCILFSNNFEFFLSNDFISHIDMDTWRWEMWGWELISGILFSDDCAFFVDHMMSFLKYGEERIYFWYSIFRQFNLFGF